MAFFNSVKALFVRGQPARNDIWNRFMFGYSDSGEPITPETAMQIGTVNSCVRLIAETIATLPFNVYEYCDLGKKKIYNDLYRMLHDAPNDEMTAVVFWEYMVASLLLRGNAYAQVIRNGAGQAVALYPLKTDCMEKRRDSDFGIVYEYESDEYGHITFFPHEILHICGLSSDGLVGESVIAQARNTIGLARSAETYGSTFFKNGGNLSGVLEFPGKLKNPDKVREAWNKAYSGAGNANKTAILEEGMKYTRIGIAPNDAQFLDTRRFQKEEICGLFRVPPHKIGDLSRATFSNIEHQSIQFVTDTIRPWLVRIEQAVTMQVLTPMQKEKYLLKFNVDAILRGDMRSRFAAYSTAIQNGIYSVNDVLEIEDMNLISDEEGGNTHFANGNFTRLADAGNWNKE